MLRDIMEALAPSLGRTIAIGFPAIAAIFLGLLMALIIMAVIWRRIASLRQRVRLANEENEGKQRKVATQTPSDLTVTLARS
jgi:hypothetical protein